MKFIITAVLTFVFLSSGSAQTKLISFKSHSGKIKHFKRALKSDPKIKGSDFGLPPLRWNFDTIVFLQKKGLVVFRIKANRNRTSKSRIDKLDTIWKQAPHLPAPPKDSIVARIEAKYPDSYYPRFIFKGFDLVKEDE